MNAVFGIKMQISVGENIVVGLMVIYFLDIIDFHYVFHRMQLY